MNVVIFPNHSSTFERLKGMSYVYTELEEKKNLSVNTEPRLTKFLHSRKKQVTQHNSKPENYLDGIKFQRKHVFAEKRNKKLYLHWKTKAVNC